ncbi:basal body-orientation factor 1-like [Synchiropus splendidus]|uniref:basal body-orientation factor 1-like n=1 Tax=Synchiropus splendidus TaxID=270530 RepID=UPI00237D92C5|nr:basal body-orientation factor 1-like [Synchiropus splendidus]
MAKKKVNKAKRSKAGKGKKDGKHDGKAEKETDVEKIKANAALWELKLQATEQTLAQYRQSCGKLARDNQELSSQLHQAEKDSVEINSFFNKRDAEKEDKISALLEALKSQEAAAREQQNKLVEDHTREMEGLKELFRKRANDFDFVQEGMSRIKEFEKEKAEMEKELSDIRQSMDNSDREHRENRNAMDYRFFKEKARLEREAEQTIAVVVERAHKEAIVQLDDASRSVFMENVRLTETLKYHMKETQQLVKARDSLAKQKASLALDKSSLEMMAKKNAAQIDAQKAELANLNVKVSSFEKALELQAENFDKEDRRTPPQRSLVSQVELERLQKVLAMREKELGHIKRLARTIVEQRTELEKFFHEALAHVRREVRNSRQQCRKEAAQAYQQQLKEAMERKVKFPPIQTFQRNPRSTNSVYDEMDAAEQWTHLPGSSVELSDLTWAQKEQVLRHLFAQMNRGQTR